MTFSIVAWDLKTQMTGVAVATKHLAVGALVPHAKAGIGAIATQGQTNPLLGIRGLQLLEQHNISEGDIDAIAIEDIIQILLQDDIDAHQRQLHLVDRYGRTSAWTGQNCVGWAGHLSFNDFSVAGNMLVGEQVLTAMVDAYNRHQEMEFCDRLLHALEAGEAAGGDKRGRQSAAVYVVQHDIYPHLDLRVDHHNHPIDELRYLFDESRKEYYQSFRQSMPTVRLSNEPLRSSAAIWSSTKKIITEREASSAMVPKANNTPLSA